MTITINPAFSKSLVLHLSTLAIAPLRLQWWRTAQAGSFRRDPWIEIRLSRNTPALEFLGSKDCIHVFAWCNDGRLSISKQLYEEIMTSKCEMTLDNLHETVMSVFL